VVAAAEDAASDEDEYPICSSEQQLLFHPDPEASSISMPKIANKYVYFLYVFASKRV
jgi:hypothetical protein